MDLLTDDQCWVQCHPLDLWIYDKLILSRKLGYKCGPAGVNVPEPGQYIVRPISNILGMGRQAESLYLTDSTDHLPPGTFWCEKFMGRHLSIDYDNTKMVLCVEGLRPPHHPLWKWTKWRRVESVIPFPLVLRGLENKSQINCEFIDGKLIEVHQRFNQDMGKYDEVIPVWKGEPLDLENEGYTYYNDEDYHRQGFWKK